MAKEHPVEVMLIAETMIPGEGVYAVARIEGEFALEEFGRILKLELRGAVADLLERGARDHPGRWQVRATDWFPSLATAPALPKERPSVTHAAKAYLASL